MKKLQIKKISVFVLFFLLFLSFNNCSKKENPANPEINNTSTYTPVSTFTNTSIATATATETSISTVISTESTTSTETFILTQIMTESFTYTSTTTFSHTPTFTPTSTTTTIQCIYLTPIIYEKKLAGGGFHSLALKSDGSLFATGANTYGQLGTGDTIKRNQWLYIM